MKTYSSHSLILLFASLVASAPSPTSSPLCTASLDGKLPSYTPPNFHFSGNVRRYYIAAEEVEWDYAPTGWDNWLGVPFNLSVRAQYAGYTTYGTKWLKALYREYTDASFTKHESQPAFQGTQGPTLRAEVGDLIEILFVNKLKKNYATMHSMGLAYTKTSEGSDYPNNSKPGENVTLPLSDYGPPRMLASNECIVYKWMVDDASGPNSEAPAKIHSYHSYVSLEQDSNAGLIGPTIVYARGKMQQTMAAYREFPILFNTYNEDKSWLSGENRARLGGSTSSSNNNNNNDNNENGDENGDNNNNEDDDDDNDHHYQSSFDTSGLSSANATVWKPQVTNFEGGGQFSNAPTFYAINGFVYANTPTFEMCVDDDVIWGFNAYGSSSHVFHMHGNGFAYERHNQYAESANDGVGKTLYTTAVGEGQWQVICHVQDHHSKGMVANYRVYPKGQCPLPPLEKRKW